MLTSSSQADGSKIRPETLSATWRTAGSADQDRDKGKQQQQQPWPPLTGFKGHTIINRHLHIFNRSELVSDYVIPPEHRRGDSSTSVRPRNVPLSAVWARDLVTVPSAALAQ